MSSKEQVQPDRWWPEHFQPRSGQEAILAVNDDDRIATSLLDLFYLRAAELQPASLLAIVGCMGETITAVSADDPASLPDDVRDQVHMCRINHRNRFRIITASSVDVFKLEALRLSASGPGFNDPVQLFGSFQARIAYDRRQLSIALVHNEGRMTVGRIDLLHAIRDGIARPFVSAGANSTGTYHALISTGDGSVTDATSRMMLLYPLADSDLGDIADNEAIFRDATYRLLTSLQGDMQRIGSQAQFADTRLPVPNRAQFVDGLLQDGYEIRGNTAYKTDRNRRPPATTFLGEFKRSVESWFAPAIGLPLEASLIDYGALIDEGLSQIATDDDRNAMSAMAPVVTDGFSPTLDQLQELPEVQAPLDREAQRAHVEMIEAAPEWKSTGSTSVPWAQIDHWGDDFTREVPQQQPPPQRAAPWWDDFSEDTYSSETVPMTGFLPARSTTETGDFRDISTMHPSRQYSATDETGTPTQQPEHGVDSMKTSKDQAEGGPGDRIEWKGDFE